MIQSGMIAAHPEHQELVRELADRRSQIGDAIRAGVQLWVGEERSPSLARYLAAVTQGISIQARDRASGWPVNQATLGDSCVQLPIPVQGSFLLV